MVGYSLKNYEFCLLTNRTQTHTHTQSAYFLWGFSFTFPFHDVINIEFISGQNNEKKGKKLKK